MIYALIGVAFSLAPYLLMGDMVRKLFSGERDFKVYLTESLIMAGCWVLRVVFHTLSTNTSHNANSFIDWMKSCIVPFSLSMAVAPATLLSVLPVGAIFTMDGSLALSDFVMVIILSCGLIGPLVTVMSYNDDVGKATSIFGEIDDILSLPELVRPNESKAVPNDHSISLQNVHFGYAEKEILHGIDLEIPEGSVTAIAFAKFTFQRI
ncbi:MAG: ABC transporter ATP-binding protein [Clostridia bacterium]|nr:ABC transporter ATP-binding protein [Clostridia bacterium]